MKGSLQDDLDEDSVGEGGAAKNVDDAVVGEAAEHGVRLRLEGLGRRRYFGARRVRGGLWSCTGTRVRNSRTWGTRTRGRIGCWSPTHAAVHGLIGQGVGG